MTTQYTTQYSVTQLVTSISLRDGDGENPRDDAGYCLDAPQVMPAGSHYNGPITHSGNGPAWPSFAWRAQ